MEASTILRSSRRSAGLTQRALARTADVPQPNLCEIETGAADVTVNRCNRVLRALGSQLAVIPTTAPTVADWAEQIASDLADGDDAAARTVFVRIADSFAALDGVLRVVLSAQPPAPTGHRGYDAALAGTVEYLLGHAALPVPAWVDGVGPSPEPLYLAPNPAIRKLVEDTTPTVFRDRDVFVPADFFDSV